MKILLIQPPKHNPKFTIEGSEPLNLEIIAAVVPYCDITIYDMRYDKTSLTDKLKAFNPDVVGITGYTVDVFNIKKIIKEVKRFNNKIFTVVGGTHATMVPDDFNIAFIEAIVLGMGEITFQKLVDALIKKVDIRTVSGLALPNSDGLFYTSERYFPDNLDSFGLPRRDLTHKYHDKYKLLGHNVAHISSARGCPYHCTFCSIQTFMKGKYITKAPEKIFEELTTISQVYIRFADGNTFANPKRMEKLYEIIKNSGLRKKYIFDIRSDTIVKYGRLIEKWKSIGLVIAMLGLEFINDNNLNYFNKGNTAKINEKALQILHQNDIKIGGQFIINQNFEKKDFEELLQYVVEKKIHFASYTILTPFPGTSIFYERKSELLTQNYEYFDFYHSVLPTKLDKKEFFNYFTDLYKKTYSLKRYFSHKWCRLLHLFGRTHETRKDVPLLLILIIKLIILMKQKDFKNAYITDKNNHFINK